MYPLQRLMDQRDHDFARHSRSRNQRVVFRIHTAGQCSRCATHLTVGDLLEIVDSQALCLSCAGMGTLTLLPSGDVALTRRSAKLSSQSAVVVEWSRRGKRYERRGTLVDPAAIDQARLQCAADVQKREIRREKSAVKTAILDGQYLAAFTAELLRLFPSCPPQEAGQIARHACEKHSGRVGRSASAKNLDPDKIRLAVIAHIRHVHTGYDGFFDVNLPKHQARRLVQNKIDRILNSWESPHDTTASPSGISRPLPAHRGEAVDNLPLNPPAR